MGDRSTSKGSPGAARDETRRICPRCGAGVVDARTIAHEIANPLFFAGEALRRLAAELGSPPPGDRDAEGRHRERAARLDAAREGLRRIEEVVRELRARSDAPRPPDTVPVGSAIESLLKLVRPELVPGQTLEVSDAVGDSARVARSALTTALVNLVRNARRAVSADGLRRRRIAIRARCEGDEVVVEVADTGPGMTAARAASAFEPGVTTKEDGAGLGLAISREAARRAGGEVVLLSEVGVGTTAIVRLPAAKPAEPGATAPSAASSTSG